MKKIEIIVAILSIIALGMNFLLITHAGILTVMTFTSLSMIYFYLGFALFNGINLRAILTKDSYKDISLLGILGAMGAGISLSLTVIGLLFIFQSWSGSLVIVVAGLSGLVIVTIIGIVKYSKNKSKYYTRIFIRAAIIGTWTNFFIGAQNDLGWPKK